MGLVVGSAGDHCMWEASHHSGLGSTDTWVRQNRNILPVLCPELRRPASDGRDGRE